MNKKLQTAVQFGTFLDGDQFEKFRDILSEDCIYEIGDQTLIGKEDISNLYESNMKEGHMKFDELIWGKSEVKPLSEEEFEVYFSDHLKHNGITHNYRCKQLIKVNESLLVHSIVHQELPGQKEALNQFYAKVGLPTK